MVRLYENVLHGMSEIESLLHGTVQDPEEVKVTAAKLVLYKASRFIGRGAVREYLLKQHSCRLDHRLHLWCNKHYTLWTRSERHVKNIGPIHGGLCSYIWVR